jgi:hypothetical protein
LVISVGFELSWLEMIHPQPHDIHMGLIVTERWTIRIAGVAAGRMAGGMLVDIADPERGTKRRKVSERHGLLGGAAGMIELCGARGGIGCHRLRGP